MRTHVEFRSSKFPAYPGESEEINPNRWGKRLAEHLQTELRKHGIETQELIAEDWGWCLPIRNDAFSMWIGCGNYEEYDDGFLVFVEPSKPFVRRGLFRKIDTTRDVERVTNSIAKVLESDSDVRGVRWWSEGEARIR